MTYECKLIAEAKRKKTKQSRRSGGDADPDRFHINTLPARVWTDYYPIIDQNYATLIQDDYNQLSMTQI